jgi:hypothetical protein
MDSGDLYSMAVSCVVKGVTVYEEIAFEAVSGTGTNCIPKEMVAPLDLIQRRNVD